ncbi:MAG TPA: hypothetical protein VFH78_05035, partial [Candidatus Thermoplasmatota archaeon]|nr:hypothetical protein [Candidatus Thermoplasmatota archaeon]
RTLGSAYPQLRAQHERSQKHKTPAKNPHHLMLLLAALEDAIAQLSSDVPTIDASAVAELEMLTELLDRWSAHPSREALLRELVDPDAFVHTLVLLAAAAYLTDAGNPVEIIAAHGAGRQCDLVIRPNRSAEVRVEIKTPRTLRARGLVQDVGVARRVVAAALSSAGTGSAGQLPHHKPGVLIVGGIRLNNEELMLLEQAGHTIMRERGAVLDHVMCLAFVGVGTLIIHDGGTRLQPSLHTRIAPNPYYRRETALSTGASTPQIRRPSAAEVSMSLDGRMAAWAFDRPD